MKKLKCLRKKIDEVDEKILILLEKRGSVVKQISKYKKTNNLPAFDRQRWNEVLKLNLLKAESLNLPKDFVRKLLTLIHKYSLTIQKEND